MLYMSVFFFLCTEIGHFLPNLSPRFWANFFPQKPQLPISQICVFARSPYISFRFARSPYISFFVCPQPLQFFLVCKNFAKFVFYFWALSIFLFRVQVCLNGYIAFFYVGWSTETFIPLLKRVLRGYQYLKSLSQNTSAKTVNLEPASASTV